MLKRVLVYLGLATLLALGVASLRPSGKRVGPDYLYPNPTLTPGLADTTSTADLLRRYTDCPGGKTTCTYSEAHRSVSFMRMRLLSNTRLPLPFLSTGERKQIYDEYNVPPEKRNIQSGEIDHFDPLCNGGSNDRKNLWYQPAQNPWNGKNYGYREKDRLETLVCQGVKNGSVEPDEAYRRITKDWVKYYRDVGLDKLGGASFGGEPTE